MTDEQEDIEETTHYANRETLFKLLTRFAVVKVVAEFDGSGDSGQVNDITCEGLADPAALKVDEVMNTIRHDWNGSSHFKIVEAMNQQGSSLRDIIEAFVYNCLQQTNYDWVNNEGGWGDVTITPADKTIEINMNKRIETSELHVIAM